MLKVLEFIQAHRNDWEELLSKEPYFLKVSRDNVFNHRLVMLKYNQLDSDFHEEIVRESRGLIFDEDSLEVVSVPFFKFGNYGESYVPNIDWESAIITEKRDGSLMKVSYIGDDVLISTNGCIDAFKAPLQDDVLCPYDNYGEMFVKALGNRLQLLEKGKTYMFELTSPYNKVVVPYDKLELALIGIRDNQSLQEELIYDSSLKDSFLLPKRYGFRTLEECIESAKLLPYSEEGYVVVDKYFNRVKIKSLAYVDAHHIKGNGVLTEKRILEILLANEEDEVLVYFPEYSKVFDEMNQRIIRKALILDAQWKRIKARLDCKDIASRKDLAMFLKDHSEYDLGFIFKMLDGRYKFSKDYLMKLPAEKLLRMISEKVA